MAKKIIFTLVILSIIAAGGFWYFKGFPSNKETASQKEKIGIGTTATKQETLNQYQAIVDYLNKNTKDEWYLVPLKDYGSFVSQMQIGQIKAGFMGSLVSYRMIIENLTVPVVRGEKNGISVYYGYIFTRKDSGLNKVEDLKNKKFAYVDAYTSAGYYFPRHLLKSMGYNPDSFFSTASFLGGHDKAILAVFNGEYDGGAAKDLTWKKLVKENPKIGEEMQILAQDGPYPEQIFMVSSGFPSEKVRQWSDLLLKMNESEDGRYYLAKFGADRFIPTDMEDFEMVRKIAE